MQINSADLLALIHADETENFHYGKMNFQFILKVMKIDMH